MSEVEDLSRLEALLGHEFRRPELLAHALRHSSYAHERGDVESNERLEFLGDAVVGLVVANRLYEVHPDWSEGDLTRGLSALVDKKSLAGLARDLSLGDFLALGRTEQQAQGSDKSTILADAMEAVLGAIFLDGGLSVVQALVLRAFSEALSPDAPRVERDSKTHFQEVVMAACGEFPSYHVMDDTEIEGDEDRFEVEVRVQGEAWARGRGRSKRIAEGRAASAALPRALAENPAESSEGASDG